MDRQNKATALGKGGQKNDILENLRSKSNSELMDEIDTYMKKAEEQGVDFDPGYIEERLSILQERDPIEIDFDPSVEIRKLPLNLEVANTTLKNKRRVKIWRIVEIAAALVIILAIVAGAGGFDVFDWLRKENTESVSLQPAGSGELTMRPETTSPEESYESLQDALDAFNVEADLCPTWIPERYTITSVDVEVGQGLVRFVAWYEASDESSFNIKISEFRNADASMSSEIEPNGYVYEHNGVEYYLFSNYEKSKCHWAQSCYVGTISGDLSFDEIEQMINSIGEEDKN